MALNDAELNVRLKTVEVVKNRCDDDFFPWTCADSKRLFISACTAVNTGYRVVIHGQKFLDFLQRLLSIVC